MTKVIAHFFVWGEGMKLKQYIFLADKSNYKAQAGNGSFTSEDWDRAESLLGKIKTKFTGGNNNETSRVHVTFAVLDQLIASERVKELNFIQLITNEPFIQELPKKQRDELIKYIQLNNWKDFIRYFQQNIGINHKIVESYRKNSDTGQAGITFAQHLCDEANDLLFKLLNEKGSLWDELKSNTRLQGFLNKKDYDQAANLIRSLILRRGLQALKSQPQTQLNDEFRAIFFDQRQTEKSNIQKEINKSGGKDQKEKTDFQILSRGTKDLKKLSKIKKSVFQQLVLHLTITFQSGTAQQDAAEILGLIEHSLQSGFVTGIQLGGKGAKPDVVVGYIKVGSSDGAINLVKEYVKSYIDGLGAKNTLEYYRARAVKIRDLDNRMINIDDWFLIEESTKSYVGVAKRTTTGLVGGSLGPNLTDQLTKIALFSASTRHGASFMLTTPTEKSKLKTYEQDLQDLIWYTVNTIDGLIASSNKDDLLIQYIGTIAITFLFDDQITMLDDALKTYFDDLTNRSKGGDHRLHLFNLQGEYYPLSIVLQAAKEQLQVSLEQKLSTHSMSEYGVGVTRESLIDSKKIPEDK